ncbi:hypothetical protein HJG60_007836 [Phyllostomus discolor]|uniref:Uncharacterized protein n=1 Tax=Phyllostomus discolor TaxID=89673 RepID=A0A834BIC5_9CHIR|nr:hypothetical protein HJG60_007836 [Phyllostomus discolor]
MPHNNLPALAQVCYYFLFKHNKMQAESYTHLEFKMFFFENDLLSSKVVTETKMKVLPKRNVTLPFHRCVRGSVLWVHPNKEAVKSFQVPDCVFVSPSGLVNHTNHRLGQRSGDSGVGVFRHPSRENWSGPVAVAV